MKKTTQPQIATESQAKQVSRVYTEPMLVTHGSIEQMTQHIKAGGSCIVPIKFAL